MNTESAVEFTGNCRLHVALTVSDLESSKHFYKTIAPVNVRFDKHDQFRMSKEITVDSIHPQPSLKQKRAQAHDNNLFG